MLVNEVFCLLLLTKTQSENIYIVLIIVFMPKAFVL